MRAAPHPHRMPSRCRRPHRACRAAGNRPRQGAAGTAATGATSIPTAPVSSVRTGARSPPPSAICRPSARSPIPILRRRSRGFCCRSNPPPGAAVGLVAVRLVCRRQCGGDRCRGSARPAAGDRQLARRVDVRRHRSRLHLARHGSGGPAAQESGRRDRPPSCSAAKAPPRGGLDRERPRHADRRRATQRVSSRSKRRISPS